MSGNKVSATVKIGFLYEFEVELEFTSYEKGRACFKFVKPSSLINPRVKVEKLHEANVCMVIGEALRYLAEHHLTRYSKWTEDYRGRESVDEVTVEDDSVPDKQTDSGLCDLSEFYLSGEHRNKEATLPRSKEFWEWNGEYWWLSVTDSEEFKTLWKKDEEVRHKLWKERNWKP